MPLKEDFNEVVFHPRREQYNARTDGKPFDMEGFMPDRPQEHVHAIRRWRTCTSLAITGQKVALLFTREDMRSASWNVKVVADVSCDIDGPAGHLAQAPPNRSTDTTSPPNRNAPWTTLRRDRHGRGQPALRVASGCQSRIWQRDDGPRDPLLVAETDNMLTNATETTLEGALAPKFAYLQDYIDQGPTSNRGQFTHALTARQRRTSACLLGGWGGITALKRARRALRNAACQNTLQDRLPQEQLRPPDRRRPLRCAH